MVDGQDSFEDAYRRGIVEEDEGSVVGEGLGAQHRRRGLRAAVAGGLALRGCVLAGDQALEDACVVVGPDGTIASVQNSRPQGVDVIETAGVILPGLIDLHGHPEFNVFAAWEPAQLFTNRYQWRASEVYQRLVRDPQNRLVRDLAPGTQARYAEIRAVVGGVTAIQGASGRYPQRDEALVRNVDLRIFGQHRARAMIDLPAEGSDDVERLRAILTRIASGEIRAFYLHLAEGRRDDPRSRSEFDRLLELDALTPATVIIHGTALRPEQLGVIRDAGAKLVWSPQSNLRLYGQTTDVATALDLGVPVGLGADWLPSGSQSLLAELKVARRVLAEQGRATTGRELVGMVTAGAARIAGLEAALGTVAVGRPADLVVLERRQPDAWDNVVEAHPAWVEAVMIGGDLAYGRADWMSRALGPEAGRLEQVVAWGKRMLLDTTYAAVPTGTPPPTLAALRSELVANYAQVGPIFA